MRRVWVWHQSKWQRATLQASGKRPTVLIDGRDRTITVPRVYPMKHNGRVVKNGGVEKIPAKRATRLPRGRAPSFKVEAVAFTRPATHGDYGWQLRNPSYDRALHVFNENLGQQRSKCTFPGGGNACARPYRQQGKSIGMPTGNFGGYDSLSESVGNGDTAKDTIDEAEDEIVEHILSNPGRFDKVYYCVNASESDERRDLIGMGIFNIDRGVRVYITDKLRKLPETCLERYRARRAAM